MSAAPRWRAILRAQGYRTRECREESRVRRRHPGWYVPAHGRRSWLQEVWSLEAQREDKPCPAL